MSHRVAVAEVEPLRPRGQQWGVAVVAALPSLLVALAMPLVIEGSLSGFAYAPLVVIVTVVTVGLGMWWGLASVLVGTVVGALVGPGGYAPAPMLLGAVLSFLLLAGTWLAQVFARGRFPALAAVPGLGLLVGVLLTGVSGSLESGVLAGFTAVSIALLLILLGPWTGDTAVRPARWAEVVSVATILVIGLTTYAVSVNAADLLGPSARINVLSQSSDRQRMDAGPPDPFLVAARWQLDPLEADKVLFTLRAGPDTPLNRPVWATFSTYNGIAWIEPPTYGVPGDSVPVDQPTTPDKRYDTSTRVVVQLALPGQWIPTPQRVRQVLSPVATRVDPVSGLVSSISSPAEQPFDIDYAVGVATDDQLRAATSAPRPGNDPTVRLPRPLEGNLADLANTVANKAGDSTWDRLTLLSQDLRDKRFTTAPGSALASGPPDRSYAGLDQVLATGEGFQEQFASIWALIARSWGIPTRVVIGFLPDTGGPDAVRTVVAPMVSIWAEARLEGLGWVAFQPSPQDREAGRPAVVRPLTPEEVPQDHPVTPKPSPGASSDSADAGSAATSSGGIARVTRSIPWGIVIPVVAIVALAAWLLFVAVRRRRVRARLERGLERGDARASIHGAWTWARLCLAESWMPLPLSYAPAIDAELPQDLPDDVARAVASLARTTGPWLYGPDDVGSGHAAEAWQLSDAVAGAVRSATGWRGVLRRLVVPLDPNNLAAPASVVVSTGD